MIKQISIIKYRKLQNLELTFSKGINVISGTNGTCKSSLLHMVSNSYQAVTGKCTWVTSPGCLEIIRQINTAMNPKIETLTKGDKTYNDPANGVKGTIFTVDYYGHTQIEFRKHNSKQNNRYAVKPWYRPGTTEKLPFCPVIYLGLARLYPFGEYQNDEAVKKLKNRLPIEYQNEIAGLYNRLTGINISSLIPQKMGDIKTRADFETDKEGIDSNTISAGEDNLFIILTSLVSLKYYYNSIVPHNEIESVLLIDEFDATLHPSLQFRLLEILRCYSNDFHIQILFTTHSLSTVEDALNKKDNVIYMIDNINSIVKMDDPDIYKIKMYLHDITRDDIYLSKAIPVFTEDEEARVFLRILFDYYANKDPDFVVASRFFHFVKANVGATNLRTIFNDIDLLKTTMKCICVLDGDQRCDIDKYIITLPGGASPEKLIMDYAIYLFDNDSDFWTAPAILDLNYSKVHFRDNIMPDINYISEHLQDLRQAGQTTHGVERDLRKKCFNKHQRFFELLFKHWVNNPDNQETLAFFYKQLNIMFKKVSEFYGINPHLWNVH